MCLRGAPKLKEAVDLRSDDEHTTHCFQYRRLIKSTSQSTTHADVSELVSNEEIENENENEKLANATRDHHYCRLKYSDDARTAVSRATNNGDNNSLNEGGT